MKQIITKRPAIIIDLDGTLCNNSHRQQFVEQSPKDWKTFYAEMAGDTPNQWCVKLKEAMEENADILLLSGRPEDYRQVTMQWLEKYGISHNALLMRKSGDFREDFVIKEEIYREKIELDYEILFAVDDRKQVVDMWRRLGLVCLQCAEGNF